MTTIGEEAKAWYDANESEAGFAAALLRCFLFGVVVKRPDLILLAEEILTDGKRVLGVGKGCPKNTWFVYYAAAAQGETTPLDFVSEAPYPLPFLAFKRRGKIKVYVWDKITGKDWDRIGKDIHHGRSPVSFSTTTT